MSEQVENVETAVEPKDVEPKMGLMSAIARVRSLLEATVGGATVTDAAPPSGSDNPDDEPSALTEFCRRFSLSTFERDLLVLCAAMELDPVMPALCAAVQGDERRSYPTFQLALAVLPDAHWSTLLPASALRRWQLVEVSPGETLTSSRLKIEESVLHFLMGVHSLNHRLAMLLEVVAPPAALPVSYRRYAEKLLGVWAKDPGCNSVVHLEGTAGNGKRALAASAARAAGLQLHVLRLARVAADPAAAEELARLWEREAILGNGALLLEVENGGPAEWTLASSLIDRINGVVMVSGSGALDVSRRRPVRITIDRPQTDEQRALWQHALGPHAAYLNGHLDRLVNQFALDTESILNTSQQALDCLHQEGGDLFALLWDACRSDSRPSLESRTQRIEVRARWEDIVLPDQSMNLLRAIAAHVRQQQKVFQEWGFSAQSSRGLGTTALFSGPSGTGKTLAAEVIANELRLDLYRIDLSQVISKYIGETEKNLRGIFDAAENSGAILLFDEADALFGKRSEVKDSHDRYANIEVSYLLQRMEAYRGLAILTTNMRNAMDTAFLRRIRFVINFPFPDPPLRRRIWERVFPKQTPTADLDPAKLARLNLPGGNIRNIALNAAFLAADSGQPVRMEHLLVAARRECSKLDKQLSDAETGGWV
jgi:AAA+ superfamily predicted ATPase